ncbi:MAG: hypothetical protein AMXMBFR53_41140 [Gemmatimonadota bacterium]
MSVLVWIAGALVLVLVVGFVRSVARQSGALTHVARGIAALRALAATHPRLSPATDQETAAQRAGEVEEEMVVGGLRPLGAYWEYLPDGSRAGITRWFADEAGTTFGWYGLTAAGPAQFLVSEVEGQGWAATYRGPEAPQLASPETVRMEHLTWEEGLASALARHHDACRSLGAPPARLVPVSDAEGAQNLFRRLKAHAAAWRETLAYEELLERDARSVLGGRFDELGALILQEVRTLEGR